MSIKQSRVLRKSFTESQFGYCPLIWVFHGTEVNNKINLLYKRSLRIVYKDNNSSFKDLLKKDNSFTVHHRNRQSDHKTLLNDTFLHPSEKHDYQGD